MFSFLFKSMEQPKPFGVFHLMFFFATIVLIVLLVRRYHDCNDKMFRKILFISWIVIFVFEIGKQIIKNYDPINNCWLAYDYSAFPWQFCSLPLYILPLLVFLKDSKFRDLLLAFSSTFVFFGGFGYFFFPVSFCENVFLNIQTMVHHAVLVLTGVFIYSHEYRKLNIRLVSQSFIFLVIAVVISMVLNVSFYHLSTNPTSVNMMELSPINKTTAIVFSDIYNATNYVTFILVYVSVFFVFAVGVFYAMRGVRNLVHHFTNAKEDKENVLVESN